MKKIAFFDAKPYDRTWFDQLNQHYHIKYYEHKLTPDTISLAHGCEAVIPFVNDTLDRTVIDGLCQESIKMIALRCAGYNNVDRDAARGRIPVVRVPGYSPYAVAEFTMGLLLTLNRKIHKAYFRTRDFNFSLNGLVGFDLHGRTVGVIGTGKIARELIRILKGFGMKVLAYDIFPDAEYAAQAQVEYVTLDELYRRADIISLHCPLTDQTRHFLLFTARHRNRIPQYNLCRCSGSCGNNRLFFFHNKYIVNSGFVNLCITNILEVSGNVLLAIQVIWHKPHAFC